MRKFSRSLLWAGLVAAGAVACGDDVTITPPPPPPPPPTPTVHSISVAPSGITLSHPGTQQMTAAVNADAGVATTVTWSAAPASVATISSSGLLTTAGAGNVAVQACSTVVTSVCGVATITVTTNPQTVTQVTVTPALATITRPATGSTTLQLSAAVSGANNPSQNVTWSVATPGLGSTVTVSSTGLVTVTSAAAGGTVNISACATVTGFTNVCGFSALTIGIPVPTTIQLTSITTGATFIPVNINNVVGQIEFSISMEPGDNVVAGVDVLIDGVVAASQNFSALQWETANAKAMAERAAGDADANVLIILSVNTAEYDCIKVGSTACTGATSYKNGSKLVSAQARLANLTPVATPTQTLIFNNSNGVHVKTFTTSGTTANALSIAGLRYDRGGLDVVIVPVIFNAGQTMVAHAGTTVIFGNFGCDASGGGPRAKALTPPTSGSDWTANFSQDRPAAGSGIPFLSTVSRYEFNGCAGFNAIGESIYFTAVDNDGDQLFLPASAPINVTALTSLRLDNRADGAMTPTFEANPNIRQNGWINPGSTSPAANALQLTGLYSGGNPNGWLLNGIPDAGVGIGAGNAAPWYNRMLRVGAGPLVDAAIATAGSGTPAAPAPTLGPGDMCAVASATDALGNETILPAAGTPCSAAALVGASDFASGSNHLLFAVDIAAPSHAFAAPTLGAAARLNGGTVGGEFNVTVVDNGTIGNSGMQTANAVRGTVQIRAQGLTPPSGASCFIGLFAGGLCNPVSVNPAPVFPLVPTVGVAASATVGFYFYRSFPQDAAGNQGPEITRVIAFDPAANVPGLTTAIYNIPLTGNSVTFTANASDNFDLWNDQYGMTYAGGFALPILFPLTVLNTFPASTIAPGSWVLVNSNVPAGFTTNSFMRQIEDVTNAAGGPLAVSGQFKPTTLNGVVQDQATNLSAVASTPIAGAQVTTGVSKVGIADPAQQIRDFRITNAAASISTAGLNGCPAGTASTATSRTINADVSGPTATFAPPFVRVDFYVVANGYIRLIGSATTPTTTDNGAAFGRVHRYAFTWTPGGNLGGVLGKILTPPGADPATVCAGAQTVYAVGVDASGDALVTPAFGPGAPAFTLVNP
jgi:hypothetical protein